MRRSAINLANGYGFPIRWMLTDSDRRRTREWNCGANSSLPQMSRWSGWSLAFVRSRVTTRS
jgi:hypothetical protein